MNRLVYLFIVLLFLNTKTFSQTDSLPPFKQYPTIPAFKLMGLDSIFFEIKDVVQKKKPTVIMVFSPTCSHCQHQTEEITSNITQLKDITFVRLEKFQKFGSCDFLSLLRLTSMRQLDGLAGPNRAIRVADYAMSSRR